MQFHVVQKHSPESCPAREGGSPETLYDATAVTVRSAVADVPGHTLYFIVEADSYDAIQDFLEPGRTRCEAVTTPVKVLTP